VVAMAGLARLAASLVRRVTSRTTTTPNVHDHQLQLILDQGGYFVRQAVL
jgi:hypothetical protein